MWFGFDLDLIWIEIEVFFFQGMSLLALNGNHFYPRAQASRVIGERAKRARLDLVMFMETRDVRLFLIPMRAFSRGYPDPPSV